MVRVFKLISETISLGDEKKKRGAACKSIEVEMGAI